MINPRAANEFAIRKLDGDCPFCNEATASLWLDRDRGIVGYQVRCGLCEARGPWSNDDGAVEAWGSVRAVEIGETR